MTRLRLTLADPALADLDAQSEKVRSLAGAERDLRESTKRSRTIFKVMIGAAVLVVLLVPVRIS